MNRIMGNASEGSADQSVVSLEVTGRLAGDVLTYGSVFSGEHHRLVTRFPRDPAIRVFRRLFPDLAHRFGLPLSFDYLADPEELNSIGISDWHLKRKTIQLLQRLENMDVKVVDVLRQPDQAAIDGAALQQLQVLGYIEP